nr:DUF3916 domain-containing protein [Lysinibacillus composti]
MRNTCIINRREKACYIEFGIVEWRINIPSDMNVLGFKEEISDEDGEIYNRDLWFIGELD